MAAGSRAWWIALGALALLTTVAGWVIAIQHHGVSPVGSDPRIYLELGHLWSSGHGPGSSAEISAGYPIFVGAVDVVRKLLPGDVDLVLTVGVVQSVVAGATVALTGVLGRRVSTPLVGLVAAGVVSLWPNLVFGSALVMSEPVATLLVVLFLVLLSRRPAPTTTMLLSAGVVLGLAVEVRPNALALLPLLLTVPSGASWRIRGRSLALGSAMALVVILPFAARSSYVTGSFVPFDLREGAGLCLGRLPGVDGGNVDYHRCHTTPGASAQVANDERLRLGLRLLREHPEREPSLIAGRARDTVWSADRSAIDEIDREAGPDVNTRLADGLTAFSTLLSRAEVCLAAIGSVMAFRRRDLAVVRVAAGGWLLLVTPLLGMGLNRFRVPSIPLLTVSAVIGVAWIVRSVRSLRVP